MNRAVWPFYRLCLYLLRRFWRRQTDEKTRQLAFRLRAVRAGDAWKGPEEYYARRAGAALGVLVYGLCAAAAIGLLTGSGWEERRITAVERPEAGAGSMETELEVRVEGEEQSRRVVVSVSPRKLTDAQAESKSGGGSDRSFPYNKHGKRNRDSGLDQRTPGRFGLCRSHL